MNRNITPRPIQATGARDAHGRILDPASGALYVHMHREIGLAHRHYVLKSWQVRLLAFGVSRPMLVLYLIALVTWGWMASQAARVPALRSRIATLTKDAERLDTLTATLADMQARYNQVQQMLGAARATASGPESAGKAGAPAATMSPAPGTTPGTASSTRSPTKAPPPAQPKADSTATKQDTTRRPIPPTKR